MAENAVKGLTEYVDIRYIEPGQAVFKRTAGGFLSLDIKPDESYPRVNLHRAFPFYYQKQYISVRDPEGKEIGMIRNANAFSADTTVLFEEELDRRYFAPVIRKINNIKEEFGYSYWEAVTDAGACRFTVKGAHQNVVEIGQDRFLIIDVDGNRFEVENIRALDEKSYRKLEIFL